MTTVGQLVLSGLLVGGIYALMSIGLTLIFGVLRVVNFAHGEFLMIAMYGAWAMTSRTLSFGHSAPITARTAQARSATDSQLTSAILARRTAWDRCRLTWRAGGV